MPDFCPKCGKMLKKSICDNCSPEKKSNKKHNDDDSIDYYEDWAQDHINEIRKYPENDSRIQSEYEKYITCIFKIRHLKLNGKLGDLKGKSYRELINLKTPGFPPNDVDSIEVIRR
jgi:hypothetical protein